MAWKRSDDLSLIRLRQRKLDGSLQAGLVCREAERLYPGIFRAVSVSRGVLHLEIKKKNQLSLKMVEGKLLQELQQFAQEKYLPVPTRIRLTFLEE